MNTRRPHRLYQLYIIDLDGTVYLGDRLLPTARETICQLRELGARVVFVSNNPTRTREYYAQKLTRLGIPTSAQEVINSTVVLVDYLKQRAPQARLFVIGEEPLCAELQAAGFVLTKNLHEIDVVVASFDRTFNYTKLQIGFDALRRGARFVATNPDPFCPVPGGGQPDAGAVIAALSASTGRKPEAVVGKPSTLMVRTILNTLGSRPEDCLIVGDRLETDVRMGVEAGIDTALVLTGVTTRDDLKTTPVEPTYVLEQLADLVPDI
ncbi:MAG: HAD-IIA family hydrolase [Chloroflexi bacterium]|nr:MAG: HAD-IIA family hydrolase [Chloroflexota bacterium]